MKGYSHALTGAAGWLALTSTSGVALGTWTQQPGVVLAGSILTAGAALAPDTDHPSGSIAYSLPPITRWLARGVAAISGGHRHGTHSLIGVAVFTLLTYAASFLIVPIYGRDIALGSAIMALLLIAFAMKGLNLSGDIGRSLGGRRSVIAALLGSTLGPWLIGLAGAGTAAWYFDYRWHWMPLAVGLGCFIHIVGDFLTIQGVPWLWPWNPAPPAAVAKNPVVKRLWYRNGYLTFPLLGTTESWREQALAALVSLYVIYLSVYEIMHLFDGADLLL